MNGPTSAVLIRWKLLWRLTMAGGSLLLGCGDPSPPSDDCLLADGSYAAAGESPPGQPCVACNADSGQFEPVFGPCVEVNRLESVTPEPWRAGVVVLGPDADGDGLGDIALAGIGHPDRESRGRVMVVRSADGAPMLELEGERVAEEFGFSFEADNVFLGPDVDGDGLADLVVSASNVFEDRALFGFPGEAPHPGRVEVWGVAGAMRLHRWEGTSDECSFGRSVALLPDIDGDALGDVMVVEGGCVLFPDDTGEPITTGWSDDGILVRSGDTGEEIWTLRSDEGLYLGAGFGVSVMGGSGELRLGYAQQAFALFEIRAGLVHVDLQGNRVAEWLEEGSAPVGRIRPWAVGADLDGDGEPDAVGTARSPGTGLILYPSVRRPVGTLVSYSDCEGPHHIVPDVDADGLHDVFVGCAGEAPALRLLNGRTGRQIWSRTLDESMGEWQVAEPRDIDGDGCVDLAAFQPTTSTVEIIRCAGD